MKTLFDRQIERADHLADAMLRVSATEVNALYVKSLTFGLRADSAALVEKQDLTALRYTKQGRPFADRLTAVDPRAYDAYLGPGVENYLLSLKPTPVRVVLLADGIASQSRERPRTVSIDGAARSLPGTIRQTASRRRRHAQQVSFRSMRMA